MRVFLLGATGNVGARLIPALLAHQHEVSVFVRSESKLKELIPSVLLSKITIITGDATDSQALCKSMVETRCNAVVNSAGVAAPFPWQAPRLPPIVNSVANAAVEASKKLGYPLRCWFLGGMALLDIPGMPGTQIRQYFPIYSEHYLTLNTLSSKPHENMRWTILCPGIMTPADASLDALLSGPRGNTISSSVDVPPHWPASWLNNIPFLGPFINILLHASGYANTLEDCADFIAADLKSGLESDLVGHRVGILGNDKGKKVN